ncbi:MAG: DUF6702 family protein [Flavobacteriales bacterium]
MKNAVNHHPKWGIFAVQMNKIKYTSLLAVFMLVVIAFRHPYHVNVIEIRHSPSDTSWQMTVRVFTHEWESVLRKAGNEKVDLKNATDSVRNNVLLSEYTKTHLAVESDSLLLDWRWIGFENKQDETWCYMESKGRFNAEIRVSADILYEHGHEQQTIVHLYVNGKRFSRRMTAPEKVLVVRQD